MDYVEPVEDLLAKMEAFCKFGSIEEEELYTTCKQYMQNSREYRQEKSRMLVDRGRDLIKLIEEWRLYYFLMTFLLRASESSNIYKELLVHCIQDDMLTKENKLFMYNQLKHFSFLNADVIDEEIADLKNDLYSIIYDEYKQQLKEGYEFIPKDKRNESFVIVIATQVIGSGHGPTKTLYDRCYVLQKYLEKKVLIVNTAEFMSPYQSIPCFDTKEASYVKEYSDIDGFEYQGEQFAFLQCPREMPQVSVVKEIMDVIQSEKPYFIVTIGDSLVGDLCSNLVPVIEIATVHSDRIRTKAQFQVIGRKVNDSDRRWMKKHKLPEDHIVESLFTFVFKAQTHQYTRTQLGLPENQFIVLVVGGRLDDEIDEECLQVFNRLAENEIFIAFMGVFDRYDSIVENNALLKKQSAFLGFQDDVLAVNECCDVYLNPRRVGGGTSCAEALYKGLPVVTLNYGDVGLGAGEDFHVKDFEDMYRQVVKYSEDKEYYACMSQKAKCRAAQLTDSKAEFARVIQKVEQSERF